MQQLEELAWQAYTGGRKAPERRPADPGYADPTYELSLTWLDAKARIEAARRGRSDRDAPSPRRSASIWLRFLFGHGRLIYDDISTALQRAAAQL